MDFMSDSIMGDRKFRTFNVMDDCTREALAIEIDTSLSSKRIIRTLESVIAWRGKPTVIRTDNGPEFTSKEFEWWCKEHEIEIQFIQPGRPMQNGYIERLNRVYREAILYAHLFTDIRDSEPSPKNGSKNPTNEDPVKHYRTGRPPNGNNKFNLNLTIKPVWKKGYLQFQKNNTTTSLINIWCS
jgi:putative transposase